jgi:hypothetical protein
MAHLGRAGDRHCDYMPAYVLNGLITLYLESAVRD